MYVGVSFWTIHSVALVSLFIFALMLYCPNYCSTKMRLAIWWVSPPAFFFKTAMAAFCTLYFHMNFRIICQFLQKKKKPTTVIFYWDCIEFINQFGKNRHICNIESFNYRTWYISPLIYVLFNFSWQFLRFFGIENLHVY